MVSIENVSKFYAGKTALEHINLTVPTGKIFGLLGPNGAGKTSLIRIITQITAPDEGKITLDGATLSQDMISLIGYLPEERGLYKKMKIGEQALYFAQLKGLSKIQAKQQIDYWFEKLEISSWKNKKVEELSKGMQQKVQFALTVLHNPKLLILDEPFTGFDPINAEAIKKEIIELKNQGTTVILSTHRMETVEELCDHIALIHRSKVLLTGSVADVRQQHKDNVFELTYSGTLPASLKGFDVLETKLASPDTYRSIIRRLDTETGYNPLLRQLIAETEIHSFREILPSINDIFISLVKGDNV